MFVQAFAVLLPLVLQATAEPSHRQSVFKTDGDCPQGVHMVGVRGTLEKPGFGALQDVVDHVIKKIPGSDAVAIDYPAAGITMVDGKPSYDFTKYVASVTEGVSKLKAEIESFSEQCPETGIVVMGYSQGAHVLGSGICGGGSFIFPRSTPVKYESTYSIKAIIQLGDPTNVRGLQWHVGNSTHGGIFPRLNFHPCEHLRQQWQSYCDDDDVFCDRGDSIPVHLGYVERYRDDIVEFVAKMVEEPDSSFLEYRVGNEV